MNDSTPAFEHLSIDVTRPWLGLLPFTESTRQYFFGRDTEIQEIHERIRENILTILFGQSGLGKTSLLGAGVLPRLREDGMSPVLLRLVHGDSGPSLLDQTRVALRAALPEATWPADSECITLWELFHRQPGWLSRDHPVPVILMDQFEEMFTLGQQTPFREAAVAAWLEQVADLIQCRPPKSLEARFAENRRLARDYDFGPCPVRFVFSLREDYLSHLEEWKGTLPQLAQNRMSLRLLDGPQALDAVLGPGSLGDSPLVSRDVAAAIVRTVARVPADTPLPKIRAVPPLLSLLCEQLNSARIIAGAPRIEASMVSERSEDILHRFYEESFDSFPDIHREEIRAVVEDRMVTVGGHRHPVAREDAEAELASAGVPAPAEVIDFLIARRLLSAEEHGRLQRLEITHDVLLPLVIRSRKDRREKRERRALEERLALETARSRKRKMVISAMVVLTLLALTLAAVAIHKEKLAQDLYVQVRQAESVGWLQRAKMAEALDLRFPDTLLYAGRSVGFEGYGAAQGSPDQAGGHPSQARNGEAGRFLDAQPRYLPVWGAGLKGEISGLSFSPGGRELAIGTTSGSIVMSDLSGTGPRILQSDKSRPVHDLAFQPFGSRLAVAAGSTVSIHDADFTTVIRELPGTATRLAFAPDASCLALARLDGTLLLTDGKDSRPVNLDCTRGASSLAVSANRKLLAAAFPGEGIRIVFPDDEACAYAWRPKGYMPSSMSSAPSVLNTTAISLSPDGTQIACGTDDGDIVLWDTIRLVSQGQIPPQFRHSATVRDLQFRADGNQLASSSADGLIRLWNIEGATPRLVATLNGHADPVTRIRYAPGGNLLASGDAAGRVKLWDISGDTSNPLDLRTYIDQGAYAFDSGGQLTMGKSDIPWSNVSPDSLAGLWKGPPSKVFEFMHKSGDPVDAAALLGTLDPATREEMTTALSASLSKEAGDAAQRSDWNLASLKAEQMAASALPTSEVEGLLAQRQKLAAEGTSFANRGGIELIWCPPGTFKAGSHAEVPHRAPQGEEEYEVTLTRGFWIGSHEVTQAQWRDVMETAPSVRIKEGPRAPVESISWDEAIEFCRRLTDRERFHGLVPAGWEYSLPTRAQWEYACRAKTLTIFSFGDDDADLHRYGNYREKSFRKVTPYDDTKKDYVTDLDHDDGYGLTAPVGSYLPNAWGIHDMHGNVSEWCLDHVQMSDGNRHIKAGARLTDPFTPGSPDRESRSLRGGNWQEWQWDNRCGKGVSVHHTTKKDTIGMRVALVPVRPPDP